jgi:hypothetical protein
MTLSWLTNPSALQFVYHYSLVMELEHILTLAEVYPIDYYPSGPPLCIIYIMSFSCHEIGNLDHGIPFSHKRIKTKGDSTTLQ